jgi:hypothetical protein
VLPLLLTGQGVPSSTTLTSSHETAGMVSNQRLCGTCRLAQGVGTTSVHHLVCNAHLTHPKISSISTSCLRAARLVCVAASTTRTALGRSLLP